MNRGRTRCALLIGLLVSAYGVRAQERPLGVIGTFTTGYYTMTEKGDYSQSANSPTVSARFEMNGFVVSPNLLQYSAVPEISAGAQGGDAGFQGGNGISMRLIFLRRLIPISFRYTNLEKDDLAFGGPLQVSGYSLKSRYKDLGLALSLNRINRPSLNVDWGTTSSRSNTGIAELGDYLSNINHFNVDSKYQHWGWMLDGSFHYREQNSDLAVIVGGTPQTTPLDEKFTQFQGSASRSLFTDSSVFLNGGSQTTSISLFGTPTTGTARYFTANLLFFQRRRIKEAIRLNYSSNLENQALTQAAASLGSTGSIVSGQNALTPFSYQLSNLHVSSRTDAALGYGVGAYFEIEDDHVSSGSPDSNLNFDYVSGSAGLGYSHRFSWGSVNAGYGYMVGTGTVVSDSGRIKGQNYRASILTGNSDGLQVEGVFRGYTQDFTGVTSLYSDNIAADINLSDHLFGKFRGHVGGGWQRGLSTNDAYEFHSSGYTANFGIDHPRLHVMASWNDALSNSAPIYTDLFSGLTGAALIPFALTVLPSTSRGTSIVASASPVSKLTLSGTWSHNNQHLNGVLNNDLDYILLSAMYRFRKLNLESGFLRINQTFGGLPTTYRNRFFVRVSRQARIM